MRERLRRIPKWLRVVGVVIAAIVLCVALCYGMMALAGTLIWTVGTHSACVEGTAGSPAIFKNGGTTLFTFPQSAKNIRNSCMTWQSASIEVWFEMEAVDLTTLIESMRWQMSPLSETEELPTFGNPRRNATYLFADYSNYPEGASLWVDTTSIPHRVYLYIWLD